MEKKSDTNTENIVEVDVEKKPQKPVGQAQDLEASLDRIEEIIGAMEQQEITLSDSMKLYKEGVMLAARCRESITDVEKEIQILESREDM